MFYSRLSWHHCSAHAGTAGQLVQKLLFIRNPKRTNYCPPWARLLTRDDLQPWVGGAAGIQSVAVIQQLRLLLAHQQIRSSKRVREKCYRSTQIWRGRQQQGCRGRDMACPARILECVGSHGEELIRNQWGVMLMMLYLMLMLTGVKTWWQQWLMHVKCFQPYPLSLDGCLGFIWGSTTDLSSSMTKVWKWIKKMWITKATKQSEGGVVDSSQPAKAFGKLFIWPVLLNCCFCCCSPSKMPALFCWWMRSLKILVTCCSTRTCCNFRQTCFYMKYRPYLNFLCDFANYFTKLCGFHSPFLVW